MKRIILLTAILLQVIACSKPEQKTTIIDGFALGTTYHLVICGDTVNGFQQKIDQTLEAINLSMSLYCDSSRLCQINRNQTDSLDEMLIYCIETALDVSRRSNGMYDITVKPLSDAWGFATKQRTQDPNVDSLLQFVGYEKITIEGNRIIKQKPEVQLDLNSIAKGSAVDIIAQLIENQGYNNYLVEIGGEIYANGVNAQGSLWRIGIDKPIEGNMLPGNYLQSVLSFSNMAMATSGNYRRYYEDDNGRKIAHTINPKTGYSQINELLSATVIAENCALADAYGTTLMALGLEEAKNFVETNPHIYAYLIFSNEDGEFQTYSSANLENWLQNEQNN